MGNSGQPGLRSRSEIQLISFPLRGKIWNVLFDGAVQSDHHNSNTPSIDKNTINWCRLKHNLASTDIRTSKQIRITFMFLLYMKARPIWSPITYKASNETFPHLLNQRFAWEARKPQWLRGWALMWIVRKQNQSLCKAECLRAHLKWIPVHHP